MILPGQIRKLFFAGLLVLFVLPGSGLFPDDAFSLDDGQIVVPGKIPRPLHRAAQAGDLPLAQKLLSQGTDINAQDKWGRTPLYFTVFKKHAALAAFLIEKGADVNLADHEGLAPLHVAALENDATLARLLLDKGAHLCL